MSGNTNTNGDTNGNVATTLNALVACCCKLQASKANGNGQ